MLLLIAQTNLSEEHEHNEKIFSQINLSEAWENFYFFTNTQINLSEACEHFYKNTKAHRAQKDINGALEQFHSFKKFKWSIESNSNKS